MILPEFILAGRRYNKFGELFVTLKFKKEDRTLELDEYFEEEWREGRPHVGALELFQDENRQSGAEDQTEPISKPRKELTIFQKIRYWYEQNEGLQKYYDFKADQYFKKHSQPMSSIYTPHLHEVISEEEADRIYEDLKNS